MGIHLPDNDSERFKCEEKFKDREGNSLILITENLSNGKQHLEIVSKNEFELAEITSSPLNSLVVKDVVKYEDRFLITENGDLISKKSNKILSKVESDQGYLTHSTKIGGRDGKCVLLRLHRLVAEAFIPNPDNKPFVNHCNGIKNYNNQKNLEWATGSENTNHALSLGLLKVNRGCDSPVTDLTKEDIIYIRESAGKISQRQLGDEFNLDKSTIGSIIRKETFKDI